MSAFAQKNQEKYLGICVFIRIFAPDYSHQFLYNTSAKRKYSLQNHTTPLNDEIFN
jgi:hypothetical protein